jgi:hypothetical protein
LRFHDALVRAAVVDVVVESGAYLGPELLTRPGLRAVVVRAVVETDQRVTPSDLADRLLLLDDRDQPVSPMGGAEDHGCTPRQDTAGATGRIVVCAAFAVPDGMPLASVLWAGTTGAPVIWELP